MNCLIEALGLALPGNGTMLATHADRKRLFLEAGRTIVDLAQRWYEQDDARVLPRGIASFAAFENAMTLDIAMGGSTNTVLHLLAAAQEAGVAFTMRDIDRLSRRVPVLCKVAPSLADRAPGGRPPRRRHLRHPRRARPRRADRPHRSPPCTAPTLGEALERWDIRRTDARLGARVLPRRARRGADHRGVQPVRPLGRARPRPRRAAPSATPRTPIRRMAAWRCCTATSPRTAAW